MQNFLQTSVRMGVSLLVSGLLFSNAAHAALVSIDDTVFGTDSVTLDTSTSLEWLDVIHTMSPASIDGNGFGRATMEASFGVGGAFEGFRFATADEFGALLTGAGITFGGAFGVSTPANIAPIQALQLLVSATQSGGAATKGMLDGAAKGELFAADGRAFIWGNSQTDAGGSWLVRAAGTTSIPEPSSIALIIAAGLALRVSRRGRKR